MTPDDLRAIAQRGELDQHRDAALALVDLWEVYLRYRRAQVTGMTGFIEESERLDRVAAAADRLGYL